MVIYRCWYKMIDWHSWSDPFPAITSPQWPWQDTHDEWRLPGKEVWSDWWMVQLITCDGRGVWSPTLALIRWSMVPRSWETTQAFQEEEKQDSSGTTVEQGSLSRRRYLGCEYCNRGVRVPHWGIVGACSCHPAGRRGGTVRDTSLLPHPSSLLSKH